MKQATAQKTTPNIRSLHSFSSGTQFDFEIGTLVQSPCRRCERQVLLPDCATGCELLARIQTTMAGGINSANSVSPVESYRISAADH